MRFFDVKTKNKVAAQEKEVYIVSISKAKS